MTIRISTDKKSTQTGRAARIGFTSAIAMALVSLPFALGVTTPAAANGSPDGTIRFIKVDPSGNYLAGAVFSVYPVGNPGAAITVSDKYSGNAGQNDQDSDPGEFEVTGLVFQGDYVIAEVTAPAGYAKDTKTETLKANPGVATAAAFTNSPTSSATATVTATATTTATVTATATTTATVTATATSTETATATATATQTATQTATATTTATATQTATGTATSTVTAPASPLPTFPPVTPTGTAAATVLPTATATETTVVVGEETGGAVVLPEVEVVEEAGPVELAATGGEGTQLMGIALLLTSLGAALFFGTQLRRATPHNVRQ